MGLDYPQVEVNTPLWRNGINVFVSWLAHLLADVVGLALLLQ